MSKIERIKAQTDGLDVLPELLRAARDGWETLSADQAEAMATIARDFGRGIIDCTTRQCFQIHWIRLEDVPEIFARLDRVGLTTTGACGDITRNVVGCTL